MSRRVPYSTARVDATDTLFTANFRPYTYWPLVLLSFAITQHLATIFIFLSVFVQLKESALDPRLLTWISVECFVVGYISWEVLDRINRRAGHIYADRRYFLRCRTRVSLTSEFRAFFRCQNPQVVDIDIPSTHVSVPCSADIDCCNFFGFYLGSIRIPVHLERSTRRL